MKTKKLFAGLVLAGGIIAANAQNVISSSTVTSGGSGAGVMGGTGSTFYGSSAGISATSTANTFIGYRAGFNTTSGSANTFVGYNVGTANSTGTTNVIVGSGNNTTGSYNTFLGNTSTSNTSGNDNVFIGNIVATSNTSGSGNIYIGKYCASGTGVNGSFNLSIGYAAGNNNTGSNNVFIGKGAGTNSVGSDLLFIDNTSTSTPLIWGNFAADQLKLNGKVGIGGVTTFPATAGSINVNNYKLFVNGGVLATEVRVATSWADYVFEDTYPLLSLKEVECFIDKNGHLPNVPSAKQVETDGISIGEMAKIQQEKIEELTLYLIQQQKEIDELKAQMKQILAKQ
ncbi:hypothetical protein [Flavobacterium suzhouense]|uniref:TMF family protein n=1 Tax=Flavobacterium suzhouense TaxID=1529638 RepID=A0ABW5NU55_9FLAO